jgi:nitronate monooxygenase
MWTRFLASKESSASESFKNAVIHASKEDLILILSSAGLPFRALRTSGTLTRDWGPKDREAKERICNNECLVHCWYTQGDTECVRMCILKELLRSTQGGRGAGLMSTWDFFDEQGNSKITSILSVEEIMDLLQGKTQ